MVSDAELSQNSRQNGLWSQRNERLGTRLLWYALCGEKAGRQHCMHCDSLKWMRQNQGPRGSQSVRLKHRLIISMVDVMETKPVFIMVKMYSLHLLAGRKKPFKPQPHEMNRIILSF
jgi:hypothetical protein